MDVVYIILIFLAPGLLIKSIKEYLTIPNSKSGKGTVYEQMFGVVAHSIIVSFFLLVVLNYYYTRNGANTIPTITALFEKFNTIYFLCKYVAVVIVISVIWMGFYKIISCLLFLLRNWYFSKMYGVTSESKDERTVLQDILYQKTTALKNPEDRKPMIVSIFKDGNYISSGELRSWNENIEDPMEWQLYHVEKIKNIYECGNDLGNCLGEVEYEYFNLESGYLVRFYYPEKAIEHWDD